jgi:hypothetical protein
VRAIRRLFGLVALVGVAIGATVVVRRRLSRPGERIDLYFADGSMTSLEAGDVEADGLFALARDGLGAARTI